MGHTVFVVKDDGENSQLDSYCPSVASASRNLPAGARIYERIKGGYRQIKPIVANAIAN